MLQSLNELLSAVAEKGGSDLHLSAQNVPIMRINGFIVNLAGNDPLQPEDCERFCHDVLSDVQFHQLNTRGDADASYVCKSTVTNVCLRTRVNVFKDSRGISFAFRLIHHKIPSVKSLGIPESVLKLTEKPHGLVIVTGPTGSGKTTTLAALLETINMSKNLHMITIEDPIEYMYEGKAALISQREVGRDCDSFRSGLKAALREDPNVILVGEMRDAETISTALFAAETGHLVFATLHTANVVEALDRMLQYFPAEAHRQMRMEIANCFEGILAQKLLLRKNGGRVAAFEVLLRNVASINLIRSGEAFRLTDYMHSEPGMQTMEDALQGLRNIGQIE